MFKDKTVVLGVTGGIACYKSVIVASELTKRGADVHVIMTKSASEFVTPLTFRTITGNPVCIEMFSEPSEWDIKHVSLAQKADFFVISPATANFIGKAANGIADDLLTSTVMATKAPILIAPAMNDGMYSNPVLLENLEKLKKLGYHVIGPNEGRLACKTNGMGRMSEPHQIVKYLEAMIANNSKRDLCGKTVLITAGPTEECIDPVRYISNRSSGKMGYELAYAALSRGANVVLISGPVFLDPLPNEIEVHKVKSAEEMLCEAMRYFSKADIVIGTAAVCDYGVKNYSSEKLKKNDKPLSLDLIENPDILKSLSEMPGRTEKILVGFALETSNIEKYAFEKIKSKGLDFVVANAMTSDNDPFGSDDNIVSFIYPSKEKTPEMKMTKSKIASEILDRCFLDHSKLV